MKRVFIFLVMLSFSIISVKGNGPYAVHASGKSSCAYDWYCNKVISGKAPPLPSEFSFINDNGGYYLDTKASDEGRRVIYLTFDCGYENGNVEKILDILKKHNAKGAFFVLSNLIVRNSDLVKRMVDDGHLVCNHTASHKDMTKMNCKEDFEKELNELNSLMKEHCGSELAPFYRPPQGRFNEDNLRWANELGYKSIFWSCAYDDWDNDRQMQKDKALNKLYSRLHNGEVLLLHPTSKTNAEILDGFLTKLEKDGYSFGTLYELVS